MKKIFFLFAFSLVVFLTTKMPAQFISFNGRNYFLNGVNIPWHLYSRDFGTHYQWGAQYNSAWFDSVFTQCENYGINCARL